MKILIIVLIILLCIFSLYKLEHFERGPINLNMIMYYIPNFDFPERTIMISIINELRRKYNGKMTLMERYCKISPCPKNIKLPALSFVSKNGEVVYNGELTINKITAFFDDQLSKL